MTRREEAEIMTLISEMLSPLSDEAIWAAWARWQDFAAEFDEPIRDCVERMFKRPAAALIALRRSPPANRLAA